MRTILIYSSNQSLDQEISQPTLKFLNQTAQNTQESIHIQLSNIDKTQELTNI